MKKWNNPELLNLNLEETKTVQEGTKGTDPAIIFPPCKPSHS